MHRHCFIVFLVSLYAFTAQAQNRCSDLFTKSSNVTREDVFFHNKDVRELFKNGVTSSSLKSAAQVFADRGTFDIPVTDKGFVAAANVGNHHGGYGRFLWFRDFARVQMGLSALPKLLKETAPELAQQKEMDAQRVRDAQLALIADSKWTEMAIKNIENAEIHVDGATGFKSVIWIRRLLDPFLETRAATREEVELESRWGHKQNDALAVFANSFFDVLRKNQMRASAVSEQARLNLLLLAAYFVRLDYWKMWDVGAWEENMGQRTSSVAMVTSFLERFKEGLSKTSHPSVADTQLDIFFRDLRDNGALLLEKHLSPSTASLTGQALRSESLQNAINESYKVITERLLSEGPLVEAINDKPSETRYEDTAIMHTFWHSLKNISERDREIILKRLLVLERTSGYVRYSNDWFLYGSAQVAQHAEALRHLGSLAVSDSAGGHRPATASEVAALLEAYAVKDMDRVIATAGKNLEAQWTLPDSYLVQMYADAYVQTRNSVYLDKAKTYFLRAAGLITGKGEMNSEGQPVEAWRLPEAYVPVQLISSQGRLETHYLVSPNSPLNWSIAEFILAMDKMTTALRISEGQ